MKILLTGSCGYVGSSLFRKLSEAGHSVFGVDTKWFWNDERSNKADIRKPYGWEKFWTTPFDVIIHLAAISNDPSVSFYPR